MESHVATSVSSHNTSVFKTWSSIRVSNEPVCGEKKYMKKELGESSKENSNAEEVQILFMQLGVTCVLGHHTWTT